MTRFGWMIILGLLGVIAVLIGVFSWFHFHSAAPTTVKTQATSTPAINPAELSIYTSGEYGFSIFYPSSAMITDAFSTGSTTTALAWRIRAVATGTPVLRIQQGNTEVRVGVSTNSKELSACVRAGSNEEARGPFAIGNTAWQEFMSEKLGTDNEAKVTSYRVVHEGVCYAVEVFAPLGNAAPTTVYSISDSITSFTFAN